jgi:hypothetical protein
MLLSWEFRNPMEKRLCRVRHNRLHADFPIMPTTCRRQYLGGDLVAP